MDERVKELETVLGRIVAEFGREECPVCFVPLMEQEGVDEDCASMHYAMGQGAAALSGAPLRTSREQESTDQEAPEARGPVGPPLSTQSVAAAAAPEAGPWKCDGCGGRMWANPAQWPKHIIVELGGNRVCGNVVSAAPSPRPPEPEAGTLVGECGGHMGLHPKRETCPAWRPVARRWSPPEPDPAPAAASARLRDEIRKEAFEEAARLAESKCPTGRRGGHDNCYPLEIAAAIRALGTERTAPLPFTCPACGHREHDAGWCAGYVTPAGLCQCKTQMEAF